MLIFRSLIVTYSLTRNLKHSSARLVILAFMEVFSSLATLKSLASPVPQVQPGARLSCVSPFVPGGLGVQGHTINDFIM